VTPAMTLPKSEVRRTTTLCWSRAAVIRAGSVLANRGEPVRIASAMPVSPSSVRASGVGAAACTSRTQPHPRRRTARRDQLWPSRAANRPWHRPVERAERLKATLSIGGPPARCRRGNRWLCWRGDAFRAGR
jgi:hypothetical protein